MKVANEATPAPASGEVKGEVVPPSAEQIQLMLQKTQKMIEERKK